MYTALKMNFKKSFSFFLVSPFELCKLTHSLCVLSMTWRYSLQQTIKMDIAGGYYVLYFIVCLIFSLAHTSWNIFWDHLGCCSDHKYFLHWERELEANEVCYLTEMESKFLLEILFLYRVMSFLCAGFVFSTSLACKVIDLKQITYACSSNHICTH